MRVEETAMRLLLLSAFMLIAVGTVGLSRHAAENRAGTKPELHATESRSSSDCDPAIAIDTHTPLAVSASSQQQPQQQPPRRTCSPIRGASSRPNIFGGYDYYTSPGSQVGSSRPNVFGGSDYNVGGRTWSTRPNIFGGEDVVSGG